MLDIWPYGNTNKELAFLITLYESLDIISELENIEVYIEIFLKRISVCLDSEHIQVIDRCMTFFEKDSMINLIKNYSTIVYPILIPSIERQIQEHWHETLKSNFQDLKSILIELNADLYAEIKEGWQSNIEVKKSKRAKLDDKWKNLELKIKESQPDYISPSLPFTSDSVVADFNNLYHSIGQKDQNLPT